MSQSTNTSVINFCDFCNLSFESKKSLYRHQSYDPKHKELLEKMFESEEEEILKKVYNSDEDDYINKTKAKTKDIIKTKNIIKTETETETKTEPCWVCADKFKNQIGLQTHMNKHWRENVVLNDLRSSFANNFNIKASFNQRQLYITKSNGSFIKEINEPVDYILDECKPFKSYKYKVTANCIYKKRDLEEEKTTNINFRTVEYMHKDHRLNLKQWLDHIRETYGGYGYDYEIIGITDTQINIEKIKPSSGSYTELPLGLRDKTKAILNIRSNKFNCLRLYITAALHPVTEHVTRENKYINNLVDDWEYNETAYGYITKIQNKYNINIWFYRPTVGLHHRPTQDSNIAKVECLEKCSNFVKGRHNIRILAWNEKRPNTKHTKYWFCDNGTYWFSSQHKYESHECCVQVKPKVVCPKLKQIKFKNQHRQQEVNNVIFSDTECYMKGTDEKIGSNTYKICEHVPIAIGYSWHSKDEVLSKDEVYNRSGNPLRRSYFGPDCIKDYVRGL